PGALAEPYDLHGRAVHLRVALVDDSPGAAEQVVGERGPRRRRAAPDRASIPATVAAAPAVGLVHLVALVDLAVRRHDSVVIAVGGGVFPRAAALGIQLPPSLQAGGCLARAVQELPQRVRLLQAVVAHA